MAEPLNKPRKLLRQHLLELPAPILDRLRGGSMLDLGCGLGEDIFWLQHHLHLSHCLGVDQMPAAYLDDLRSEAMEQSFLRQHGHPLPFSKYQFTAQVANQYELYGRQARSEWGGSPLGLEEWKRMFEWKWDTDVRSFVGESTETFDVVFCAGVLHWLPAGDQMGFLEGMKRLVAKGGVLALEVNVGEPMQKGERFAYPAVEEVEAALKGQKSWLRSLMDGKLAWIGEAE